VDKLAILLEGDLVVLEPLEEGHEEALWRAAQGRETWCWLPHVATTRKRFDEWIAESIEATDADREGVFAIRDRRRAEIVGSSRYLNVRPADRCVEIGSTWLNPSAWRTGVNVETKLLMLRHAFETLGCVRVELKTDARNQRSRAAMAALPARFEGVMRNHMIVTDVGLRDSAYFSVIEEEWPEVRANLHRRLSR
jgi:RimJ/RimL family protein N-acetyltransferase